MAKLSIKDRAIAAQAGWTAECAQQPQATHLANSYHVSKEAAKSLPETLPECLDVGAAALRAHLKSVRK